MRDTDYAFCVARLRANERYMLTPDDFNALIDAKTYKQAVKSLIDKGYISQEGSIHEIIFQQSNKLWNLLESCVPSKKELDILCVINDFFNIKAALKCYFSGDDAKKYFVEPTTVDLKLLIKAVNEHDFSILSGDKGVCAKDAYQCACTTSNGQNAEIIIDRAAICALSVYGKVKKISVIRDISAFLCDTANIKIALRCQKANKSADFIDAAIGDCVYLNRSKLLQLCVSEEKEGLMSYLKSTRYSNGIAAYEKSASDFDRWCDENILRLCSNAKYTSFGFDPVCAFYYSKLNEIKNLRIILTCKQSGVEPQEIRQRVGLNNA